MIDARTKTCKIFDKIKGFVQLKGLGIVTFNEGDPNIFTENAGNS